jgi:hypothetical protein
VAVHGSLSLADVDMSDFPKEILHTCSPMSILITIVKGTINNVHKISASYPVPLIQKLDKGFSSIHIILMTNFFGSP